jgi:two-component sensor histidine kinase
METCAPHRMEERALSIDGSAGREVRYWTATHTPVFDAAGAVVQIVSAVQDITGEVRERRREEMRQLLVRELDHRARNTLAIMQTFVRLTDADTVADYRASLEGRVAALARAQNVLASGQWESGRITDLVQAKIASMAERERVEVSGPDLVLTAERVQSLSMVLHELATNARKYGALATPDGTLRITWRRDTERVAFVWEERGAKDVKPPRRSGFGSRLIDRLLKQMGGCAQFEWRPSGVLVQLDWPLATTA